MNTTVKLPVKIASALITMLASIHVAAAFDETAAQTVPPEDTHVFTDIDLGHKHYVAIKYLKENGLIEGYEDGSFKPLNEINRAEALKILIGALDAETETADEETTAADEETAIAEAETETMDPAGTTTPETSEPDPTSAPANPEQESSETATETAATSPSETVAATSPAVTPAFADVPADAWFYGYVLSASENNVVDGYPDGLFHPENTINRAESLKIALLLEGGTIPAEVTEPPYSDVPVDAWYAPYAQVSSERSLIIRSRADGSLNAGTNMNRGDFADLVYRMIKSKDGNRFAVTTWYGFEGANWGTASGEKFDTALMTAAHKTLPFGTFVKVTNLANNKSVVVKINDRGPYAEGMDLDLTSGAFEAIASLGAGVIVTEYEIIDSPDATPPDTSATDTSSASTTANNETSEEIEYGF